MFSILLGFLALVAISGVRIVSQQSVAIIETFGKYSRTAEPGITWIIPGVQQVAAVVSLQVVQTDTAVEVKTSDDSFVNMPVAIMLRVNQQNANVAHYELRDPTRQISTWVLNVLRATASSMTLESLYSDRSKIVDEVKQDLTEKIGKYGYSIIDVLVDQPSVSSDMQAAFNNVISSKRNKEAAAHQAEANRVLIMGNAQAEADSQVLRAKGLASARKIMAESISESVAIAGHSNIDSSQIMQLLIETNRMDAIRAVGAEGNLVLMDVKSTPAITLPEASKK